MGEVVSFEGYLHRVGEQKADELYRLSITARRFKTDSAEYRHISEKAFPLIEWLEKHGIHQKLLPPIQKKA